MCGQMCCEGIPVMLCPGPLGYICVIFGPLGYICVCRV